MSRIACYCTCGSSLTGRANKPEIPEAAWAEFHSGEGHAPTDAKGAAAARRRERAVNDTLG
jgi:hypothetical protein